MTTEGMRLYDAQGRRKYLTADERARFLAAAEDATRETRTFCLVLAHTGCRISEALELTPERVDLANGTIVFESLKKRRTGRYRAVPVPPAVLDAVDLVHDLKARQKRANARRSRLWAWSRTTAWRRVAAVMRNARLSGPHATPKGLRHGFGVAAVNAGIPLNMVQKWLGHAQLSTTAIYADAVGAEEKAIASRMWG
jgi:integrase